MKVSNHSRVLAPELIRTGRFIKISIYQKGRYQEVLKIMLDHVSNFLVVGSSDAIINIESDLTTQNPDVVLLDIFEPRQTIGCLRILKENFPKTKIVILTDNGSREMIFECLKEGADGFLLRDMPYARLEEFINEVYQDGVVLSPSIARMIVDKFKPGVHFINHDADELTRRESEVLKLLVDGMSYKLVGFSLDIALDTVRSHIKKIYEKLNVNSKSEAVAKALKEKIVLY